jgi:hypothetical protein
MVLPDLLRWLYWGFGTGGKWMAYWKSLHSHRKINRERSDGVKNDKKNGSGEG